MQVRHIEMTKVKNQSGELSDIFYRICMFCDKVVMVDFSDSQSVLKLGGNKFYCPFCLRHNHHFRSARNVLIMSYRAIVGYYYYRFYNVDRRELYFHQIDRDIEKQAEIGLQNPVFSFDPETLLWFVNFNRIGKDHHKAPFEEVLKVAKQMYEIFEVENWMGQHANERMWSRFEKAIRTFYQKRKRPKTKKMLIPTFAQIVNAEVDGFWDDTRNFVKANLIVI